MQFRTFMVSAHNANGADELNQFLRGHRVVSVTKQFVQSDSPGWCFCVEYLAGDVAGGASTSKSGKVDYREVLKPDDFAVFAELRDLRKKVADDEGVPVYAVFTNEQLAQMAQQKVCDKAALGGISGIGAAKLGKYGDLFVTRLQDLLART